MDEQKTVIQPLTNILMRSGCEINVDGEFITMGQKRKKIVIYPAMWAEPNADNTVFVSDFYIKYAKPYAVQKILDNV